MKHCASKRLIVKNTLTYTYQLIIQIIPHPPHLDSSRLERPYAQSKHQHNMYICTFCICVMCIQGYGVDWMLKAHMSSGLSRGFHF